MKFRCSLLDVAQLAVPAFLLLTFTYTIADADLWGHLRFGADILHGSGLSLHDPYSFTSDTAWINHEWLAEAFVAAAYGIGGAIGLNLLKLSVIGVIGLLAWQAGREEHGSRFALVFLSGLVVFASYTRTQVLRPQLFSVLLFAILITLLRRRERGHIVPLFAVPALFCVWVNTHGGWLVGFAALTVWSALTVLEERTISSARRASIDVTGALAATLINPYGTGMWTFLQQTVGLNRDISDWTPFVKFPAALIALELVLPTLAVTALVRWRQRPPMRDLGVVAVLAFGTYRVGRVDAFLHIAIGLLFAAPLVALLHDVEAWLRSQRRFTNPAPVHAIAAAGLALYVAVISARHAVTVRIDGTWIPDAEAMRFLEQDAQGVRLLTWFDWGEYAIWHLSPKGTLVSMDGRRETVYGPRVLDEHWAFYRNQTLHDRAPWEYPDAIGAQRIWLPKKFPVVQALKEKGWHVAFESDVSVVLSPNLAPPTVIAQAMRGPRAFPGP